jgi:hypothetical protein
MDLTPFEEYSKEFKEDLKRQVLEVLNPWVHSYQVKMVRYYMDHFSPSKDYYWWNRDAFYYILSGNRLLFTDGIASKKTENDWAHYTVTAANQIAEILKNPEVLVKEITEE